MLYAEIIVLLQLWPWPWPWPGLVVELTGLGLGTCGLVNIPEDFVGGHPHPQYKMSGDCV